MVIGARSLLSVLPASGQCSLATDNTVHRYHYCLHVYLSTIISVQLHLSFLSLKFFRPTCFLFTELIFLWAHRLLSSSAPLFELMLIYVRLL
uniref:Putative secreted protein n=1 Tax=Panstrongylus lignarius TaxID=156445 RepID=A0A224Y3X8_9HEMI